MFNIDKFIADYVTKRPVSMFAEDIEANKEALTQEIRDKKVCVIGGAGAIGSPFIRTDRAARTMSVCTQMAESR